MIPCCVRTILPIHKYLLRTVSYFALPRCRLPPHRSHTIIPHLAATYLIVVIIAAAFPAFLVDIVLTYLP